MAQATKLFDISTQPVAVPVSLLPRSGAGSAGLLDELPGITQQEKQEQIIAGGMAPRKLVRPRLPEHLAQPAMAPRRLRGMSPLVRHEGHTPSVRSAVAPASHAEALYFQKQMQTQTPIVFVLEDGERIEGVIEWFDRDTIKVRNTTRVLLFKRSIKYLFKAGGDQQG